MKIATIAGALCMILSTAASAQNTQPLVAQFMQAWNAAGAKALGALFAPDADLVTPTGIDSKGREAIEAFYAAVLAHGYAGSKGVGEVVHERALSPEISLVDTRFSISNAKNPDGSPRSTEMGIMAAIVRRTETGWQILALRENAGASNFTPFLPR
jgi:uncharacterized protein (TIGR02246 family)